MEGGISDSTGDEGTACGILDRFAGGQGRTGMIAMPGFLNGGALRDPRDVKG